MPQPVKWTYDNERQGDERNPVVVEDPFVNYGEPWIESPLGRGENRDLNQQVQRYKENSIYAHLFLQMHQGEISIREKLLIFWHNHFVVSNIRFPELMYRYLHSIHNFDLSDLSTDQIVNVVENLPGADHDTIEDFINGNTVLGNFKNITKAITIDLAMLLYLNGNENSSQAPNENYARELLELFTIGKGNLAGPGDYTTYTEDDVTELSKILTGWSQTSAVRGGLDNLHGTDPLVEYYSFRHDKSSKQLSNRLGNVAISNEEHLEFSTLIDRIFDQAEVARNICRELYRYFVYYHISPEVEQNVIEPMAQQMIADDYEVEGAVRLLLGSDHFFSEEAIGCMIKNPADYLLSITHGMNVELNKDIYSDYYYGLILNQLCGLSGMQIFEHTDVAGWKAYYQSPQYYRIWLNSATLPDRTDFATALTKGGTANIAGNRLNLDPVIPVMRFLHEIENGLDPNEFIHSLADLIFPYGVTEEQKDYLKTIMLDGQQDFVWTERYSDYFDYVENVPDYENNRDFITVYNELLKQLRRLVASMLEMPEAQLM